jgi:RNA polymerase sigma-70 factor (ECF subfamily)
MSESQPADPQFLELSRGSLEDRLTEYRPRIERHIRAMTRDTTLAQDLTQETYLRALQRLHQLRDPQAALAWLYRIATSVTLDRLRQRRPEILCLDDTTSADNDAEPARRPESLIEAALERDEMSQCVQNYLQGLSDDYRVAILLHDMYGLTNPEIATIAGSTLATAKIRVHRARQRLRTALDEACTFETDDRGVLVCNPR